MLTPYIITAALFRMLDSIQQFDIIYAMTQGGPGDTLMVFQVMAYLEFFQNFNVGRSAAVLMVLWAIAYLLSNIFIKHWLRLRERAGLVRVQHHAELLVSGKPCEQMCRGFDAGELLFAHRAAQFGHAHVVDLLHAPITFGTSFSWLGCHWGDSRMKNHTSTAITTSAPAISRWVGR